MALLVSSCKTQPAPTPVVAVPSPTAVPIIPTNTPTNEPPTATAVPTAIPTPTPTVPPIVPLHFDHLQDVLPEDEIEAQLAPWLFEPDVANALPLAALADVSAEGAAVITAEQAKEDIAYLFALLKNGYAGYGYFNENGRFDRVQAQLNAAIGDQARVSRVWLLEEMLTRLDFVQDCHFTINSYPLCEQQYFWYVEARYFYEADGRFFIWQEGEQWWLTGVDGEPPDDALKLTFDEQGAPAYLLGQLANSQPEGSLLSFELPDGTSLEEMVVWETAVFEPPVTTYETYRTDNDIPVVVSRLFPAEDEKLTQFVVDAASLADESIAIVDIRGNGGGSSFWGELWVESLTGVAPTEDEVVSVLWTETAVQGKINAATYLGYSGEILDWLDGELAFVNNAPEKWITHFVSPVSAISNQEQLVVVLMDKGVASSGEAFIGYLHQLDNVVFVGENSGGVGQFGELARFVLPNTALPIYFGTKLFFPADLSLSEGIGYLPDVWVPADKALDKTLAAIEAGWLQPGP